MKALIFSMAVAVGLLSFPGLAMEHSNDLVLRKCAGQTLTPAFLFPSGSRVRGIELISEGGEVDTVYYVSSPLSLDATYAYYRQKYATTKVNWYGKKSGSNDGVHYAFGIVGSKTNRPTPYGVLIYPNFEAKVADAFSIPESAKNSTTIVVSVGIPVAIISNASSTKSTMLPVP